MPDGYQPGGEPTRPWPGWVRVVIFVLCYVVLQGLYAQSTGTAVERFFLVDTGSKPAAQLINAMQPAIGARAIESRIVAPGGGINIANGCEGTDIYFLLIAAFAAAALPRRQRAAGLVLGLVVAFVLNQARIIALFHAFRNDRSLFELLHTTILPVLLVAAVGLYFHACLRLSQTHRHLAG
jgi:exosortase/archaeosortase family protein